MREWLLTFPFPPIPIDSIPIPSRPIPNFLTHSHSHGIPSVLFPFPPIPIPIHAAILDILTHSGDIHDEIRKLYRIDPNFSKNVKQSNDRATLHRISWAFIPPQNCLVEKLRENQPQLGQGDAKVDPSVIHALYNVN